MVCVIETVFSLIQTLVLIRTHKKKEKRNQTKPNQTKPNQTKLNKKQKTKKSNKKTKKQKQKTNLSSPPDPNTTRHHLSSRLEFYDKRKAGVFAPFFSLTYQTKVPYCGLFDESGGFRAEFVFQLSKTAVVCSRQKKRRRTKGFFVPPILPLLTPQNLLFPPFPF